MLFKILLECFITIVTRMPETGMTPTAIRVICQLMLSIIISAPITEVADVMIWDKLWFSVWLTVSISFVTRERISPWFVPSKYFNGRRFIFSEIRFLRL